MRLLKFENFRKNCCRIGTKSCFRRPLIQNFLQRPCFILNTWNNEFLPFFLVTLNENSRQQSKPVNSIGCAWLMEMGDFCASFRVLLTHVKDPKNSHYYAIYWMRLFAKPFAFYFAPSILAFGSRLRLAGLH